MFNKDFYPTPPEVIEQLLFGLDVNQMTVLEPSAGSGAILKVLREKGAYTLACEKSLELQKIAQTECNEFIKPDFLEVQSQEVSHIDFIVMNPPFSKDEKHMLHAWEIAPQGCIIKSLCNSETVDNRYSRGRRELNQIIAENGNRQGLGECFSTAERKTDVNVTLVTLYKPKTGEDEFEGFFDMAEEEEQQANGLIQHNEIREIVNRYIGAVKMFESVEEISKQINILQEPFGRFNNISFGAHNRGSDGNHSTISREQYKKSLQKSAWKTVFAKMKMEKYVTKPVLEKLNVFVEKHTNVPFKIENIYKMINMIVQTYEENMNNAIIDIFEKLTRHTHENRYEVEGWKSNSDYLIAKKFIMPWMTDHSHNGGMGIKYNGNYELLNDLTKSLCFLTGQNYDNISSIWNVFYNRKITDPEHYRSEERRRKYANEADWYVKQHDAKKDFNKEAYIEEKIERDIKSCPDTMTYDFGKWYEWGFFEFKGFKKGTMHFRFKDEEDWAKLNKRIAEIKGLTLPTKF